MNYIKRSSIPISTQPTYTKKAKKKQTNKQTINQVYALFGIYYLNDIQPTT